MASPVLSRDDLFGRVLCHIVLDPERENFIQQGDDRIALIADDKKREAVLVVRYDANAEGDLTAAVKKVRRTLRYTSDIVLVGGDKSARRILKKSAPMMTQARQRHVHVTGDLPTWSGETSRVAKRLAPGVDVTEPEWARFVEQLQAGAERFVERHREAAAFQAHQTKTTPIVTYAFLAVVGVMFGLQMLLGIDSFPVLLRMGALRGDLLRDGELWRLFSVAVLHGNFTHFVFNAYVLFALGSFLERIVGSTRFAVILFVSILGGSIASGLLMNAELSVGASGGLWGILVVHAILAFRSGGLLPTAMIPHARRAAKINLGLNLVVSFLPMVDWAAHLGGGLAGGAVFFFALRRGLPKLEMSGGDDVRVGEIETAPVLKALALFLAALFVVSIGTGLILERPFALGDPPTLVQVTDADLGVSFSMPTTLLADHSADSAPGEKVYGNFAKDPASCAIMRFDHATPIRTEDVPESRRAVIDTIKAPPNTRTLAQPALTKVGGREIIVATYAYKNDNQIQRVFHVDEEAAYRAECVSWATMDGWHDVAKSVGASIQPTSR